MTKEEYHHYLRSSVWQEIRRAMLDLFPVCQVCKFPYELNVHHRTYERVGGGERIPDDLEVLCKACHTRTHFLEDLQHNEVLRAFCWPTPEKVEERLCEQAKDARTRNLELEDEKRARSKKDDE